MLAFAKLRSGGKQSVRVVHQHVIVEGGAQAVVADNLSGSLGRNDGVRVRNARARAGGKLLGVMLGGYAGLLGVMTHGFHWL